MSMKHGNFSRVNIGLFCSTPGVALARAVPRKIALEMLFTGNPITAEGEGDLEIIVYQLEGVFLKDDFLSFIFSCKLSCKNCSCSLQ